MFRLHRTKKNVVNNLFKFPLILYFIHQGMKESNGSSTSAPESAAQQDGGVAKDGGVSGPGVVSGHKWRARQLQGLQRENGRLVEQLRSSEELNATLRCELDLHRSILVQGISTPLHAQGEGLGQSQGQAGGSPQNREDQRGEGHPASQQDTAQLCSMNPGTELGVGGDRHV